MNNRASNHSADREFLLLSNQKILDNAFSKSKKWFLPYIVAFFITIVQYLFIPNMYSTVAVLLISLLIARYRSISLLNPTMIILAESDPRPPLFLFVGYADFNTKTDIIYGIGQSVWHSYRPIMLENADHALGYHFSEDRHGIIVATDETHFELDFHHIAQNVNATILVIDNAEESIRAIKTIHHMELHQRTIVVMLPEIKKNWNILRERLKSSGFNLPFFNPEGMMYIPKKDFSIANSHIFETGTFDGKAFLSFLKDTTSKITDTFTVQHCIPQNPHNRYLETFFFSDIAILPHRESLVDLFVQQLTFKDPKVTLMYLKKSLFDLIENPKDNSNLIQQLINDLNQKNDAKHFIKMIKNFDEFDQKEVSKFIKLLIDKGLILSDEGLEV